VPPVKPVTFWYVVFTALSFMVIVVVIISPFCI
jgi:hypothetical protein